MSAPLVVRIPLEQKNILEVFADRQNLSMGEITRRAISEYLTKKSKKNLFMTLAEIGQSKKVANAPKNLSTSYKKHLYQ